MAAALTGLKRRNSQPYYREDSWRGDIRHLEDIIVDGAL